MQSRVFFLVFLTIVFVGCSSKTTVLLLDSGKSHNAIIVSTSKGSQKIDKSGSFIDLKDKNEAPNKPKVMSEEEIKSRFSNVLSASPLKPISYILYFKEHSTELTKESEAILDKAIASMQERVPCMVDIIGHTDTTGSNEINIKVSRKRATHINSLLEKRGVKVVSITAKGYGEEDLLVSTPNNTAEAKNRNVEVFIR